MNEQPPFASSFGDLVLGVVVVTLAILLAVGQLSTRDLGHLVLLWPLIPLVMGLDLLHRESTRDRGIWLVLMGSFLVLIRLLFAGYSEETLAIALMVAGIIVLFNARKFATRRERIRDW